MENVPHEHAMQELQLRLIEAQQLTKKRGEEVRQMKAQGASKEDVAKAVELLNAAKKTVEELQQQMKPAGTKIDFPREQFTRLLTQRFFVAPSFEIYGGIAGLYDLGPPGTAIKANLLAAWRNHFVLPEGMLEVDCTSVTPQPVLDTSGHTAKFADLMVKDLKNGQCYRADHLLEQHLDKLLEAKDLDAKLADEYKTVAAQADAYSKEEMGLMLKKYGVKAPETGNDLSDPEPFNLMFATSIGPTGQVRGFLRPETAQGIFVNFKRLLEYNGGKLPFAGAQIGQAYRNEIAPRSGLLRVREFTLAEIEHFVHPEIKDHPKFAGVASTVLTLFPRELQTTTKKTIQMPIGEAVKKGIVANETLGYFMARTHAFLLWVGIKPERLRFRQHLRDEMAHYACDCWDAEIQNSYGWTECVGIADRSAYDLTAHSNSTKTPLVAHIEFEDGPREVKKIEVVPNKKLIGQTFKNKQAVLLQYLATLDNDAALQLEQNLKAHGKYAIRLSDEFEVTSEMLTFKETTVRESGKSITPGVIEPSFGIGRILYMILEHSYYVRPGEDSARAVLALPAHLAPLKVSVLPHMQQAPLLAFVPKVATQLSDAGISFKVDESGASIGKRYARMDEIGVPFGITIDRTSLEQNDVTLRERDTTTQVRVPVDEVAHVIQKLAASKLSWSEVQQKYPAQEAEKE